MKKPVILVTGANGQLGREFRALERKFGYFQFVFATRDELPIQEEERLIHFFSEHRPAYCINCAAYTMVDKAESDQGMAFLINAAATGLLAAVSKQFNTNLIHISTDYVFDGQSSVPYTEKDNTHPVNVYGASKLEGEKQCLQNDPDAIIIRTSWVYSAYGNNFVKTMLRLMKEKEFVNVVNDQVGTPTYAADLAEVIMNIIAGGSWHPGIYHYSNSGNISWYEFAQAIKELSGISCQVNPIPAAGYPTPAKRPSFSLLNTAKIEKTFSITIPGWRTSLEKCLHLLKDHS